MLLATDARLSSIPVCKMMMNRADGGTTTASSKKEEK